MSINWVMLDPAQGFVRLPGEKPVWKSSPRVSLSISTPRAYPAHEPLSIQSSSGTLYLTNQRVVYLPEKPTEDFKSFSSSLLNLHDSHITFPWFGPNAWQALVQPVAGGNIPNNHHIELKLTFKDGGAPDFHTNFERIKERLQQALKNARDINGVSNQPGTGGINMDSVHLDELPAYEDSGHDRVAPPERHIPPPQPAPVTLMDEPIPVVAEERSAWSEEQPGHTERPSDAPPGYEETQQQGIEAELSRQFERGD